MASRSIRTEIWNDEFICEETKRPLDRLLYVYLLTNDRTHICGFYKLSTPTITAETGMKKKQIFDSFERLYPKVIYKDGWVCIENYRRYQAGGGDSIEKAIENEKKRVPDQVKDHVFDVWSRVNGGGCREGVGRVSREASSTSTSTSKQRYGEFENVLLDDGEYKKLVDALGEAVANNLIAELSSYIASTGKRYQSHYATLQNWARRKIAEHATKVKVTNQPKRQIV